MRKNGRCNKNPWQPNLRRFRERKAKKLSANDALQLLVGRIMETSIADAERITQLAENLVSQKETAANALQTLKNTATKFILHLHDSRPAMAAALNANPDGDQPNGNAAAIAQHVQTAILHRLPKNLVALVLRKDHFCPLCGNTFAASRHSIGEPKHE